MPRAFLKQYLDFFRSVKQPEAAEPRPDPLQLKVEAITGFKVGDMRIYRQALKHRSLLRGQPNTFLESNERHEFLGDAVLGLIVAEYLYEHFPDRDEGFLTRMRAHLVNTQALAAYAEAVHLGAAILMSDNMDQSDGRRNQTILADAFEAMIGAVYLDIGYEAARAFVLRTIQDEVDLSEVAERRDNFKSILLEYAQERGWPQPTYQVAGEEGPGHAKQFTVRVVVNDYPLGQGLAKNKKSAEQLAAKEALERLRKEEQDPLTETSP